MIIFPFFHFDFKHTQKRLRFYNVKLLNLGDRPHIYIKSQPYLEIIVMIRYSRILILFTTQRSTMFSDWLKHTVRTLCLWNLTVYKKTSFNLYSIEMGQTKLLTKSPLFDNGYFYYYLNCIVHTQTCHGYGFRYSFLNFGDWNSIFPTIACLL